MTTGRKETINVIAGLYALSVGQSEMPTPKGWCWSKLLDIADLESGHTPSRERSEYWNGDVPWVGIRDGRKFHGRHIDSTLQTITEEGLANSSARWLPKYTVCLSRTASIGYVTVLGRAMATSQDFVNWVCSEAIDPDFLMHLLIAEHDSLLRFGKGSTHKTIYFPEVKALHVCVPPMNEQRRIVARIEALFERSRRARQALDAIPPLIDKLRQSILAAAFRGDLTADWRAKNPDVEPAERLLQRIRAERRLRWEQAYLDKLKTRGHEPNDDRWKEKYQEPAAPDTTNLPPLPEGWVWATMDFFLEDIDAGKNFKCEERPPESDEIGVVKVSAVTWGDFDETESKTCTRSELINEDLLIHSGDFLFSRANTIQLVGACVIVEQVSRRLMLSDKILRFRTIGGCEHWLLHSLRSPWGRREIERLATGNQESMRNIGQDRIRGIRIPVPPREEMQRILAKVEHHTSIAGRVGERARVNLRRYQRLLQAILAKAFRGELVPQDPDDEPASVLLERIRADRQDTPSTKRGRPARSSESGDTAPATPRAEARPEPQAPAAARLEPRATARVRPAPRAPVKASARPEPAIEPAQIFLPSGLAEQDPETIQDTIYAALWGRGPLEVDAAVRTVAEAMRDRGLVQYQRLRADGPLYADIKKAIDTAVRAGHLDRPRRGHVRAVEPNARDYTTDDWRVTLLAALDGDGQPVDREQAITRAAEWARDNMGLEFQRLRAGGVIESGIKSAINSAIRRGELERIDATRIQRRT